MTHARTARKSRKKGGDGAAAGGTNGARRRSPASETNARGAPYAAGPAHTLSGLIQTQLTVGPVDDPYEREADAIAQRVTASPGPAGPVQPLLIRRQAMAEEEAVQRQPEEEEAQRQPVEEEPVQPTPIQRQTLEEEEPIQRQSEEEEVQRQPAGEELLQPHPIRRQALAEEEPIRRVGNGRPRVPAKTASTIRNPGAGRPLQPGVRRRIEPHVGADLGKVRVHSEAGAGRAAASLGARAFTHRNHIFLGSGESGSDVRLLAHEATHVVQQGAAPVEYRSERAAPPQDVQRLPDFIMEELNDYARHIPGYTLFTVIIGYNPLLGERVERNAMNLLEGLMGLVPFGTAIFDKLREYGIIQDAFAWIEGQLSRLDLSLSRIERTIEAAWDDVSIIEGWDYNLNVLKRHFGRLYDDVVSFAESLVDKIIELIKEAAIGVAEELLAENQAWDLIKKVIHYDPLRDEEVEASTVEILEDFLLLIGKEQEVAQMKEKGTLQETADWLDTQIGIFIGLLVQLRTLIASAWDAIQPENLPNLATNLQTLATQVFSFLQQVWDFASTVALKVLELIKNALLSALSDFAHQVPGFHLITVIIGRNPFTGEPVPRTAENIIRGFITLLPGGNETYQQLVETGTIAQAAARIEGAMAELGISWEFVVGLFTGIWESLTIEDLIDPIGAFVRIRNQFGEPISRLVTFVTVVVREIFMILLEMMNFPTDLIGSIISNAMQAFESIRNDPIGFLLNLLRAVKLGFTNFFANIVQHLVGGLADWLFRGLRDAGIEPPTDLSLASILDLVLQVLGLTIDRIWEKLAERIGQETVDRIRGAIDRLVGIWNFVRDVQERGVVAIWEYIESQISNLWNLILEKAQEWVMERIINRAIQWLLSLLDPTGIMPVINSFIAFFRAVQSAIEYLRDILAIINDYVTTVAAIARGDVQPGAEKLEEGLANAIPIAIGFLANQFGLGNIAEKVQEIIAGIREVIDRALDWLIDRAVNMVQTVLSALGFGGGEEEAVDTGDPEHDAAVTEGLAEIGSVEQLYAVNGKISREDAETVASTVKERHPVFLSLTVVDGDDSWNYAWTASEGDEHETPTEKLEACPSPGVSAPGIDEKARHGDQPPGRYSGPRVHHIQSEHIIPFATARSLRLAVGLTERSRAVLRRFDNGMLTLTIYRGAAEEKNEQDNIYSAQFESEMLGAQIPEKTEQAIQQYEGGNVSGGETLAREVVSSVTSALERLRQSAVTRTQREILAEWASVEPGCDETNGQRRGEEDPVPSDERVAEVAEEQLDGIIDLVAEALRARALQEAEQPSWEGRSLDEPGIFDELERAGYYRPRQTTTGRWIIGRPPNSNLRRLTGDKDGIIHHTEE